MSESQAPIYFPLGQGERASHLRVNQLLARTVYERLAQMLHDSLPEKSGEASSEIEEERFQRERAHSTIFLDGDRGTGKTTVIVNLRRYLESPEVKEQFPELANDVHIFQSIDPSQLEDGDNLFLDVVVAAVLGDKQVNAQRDHKQQEWQLLHGSLQRLGNALQGSETQNVGFGLDKLRAFMGSRELAGAVHEFFSRAATLLGKRLLVLPIDDVDTTLHRAFENLEVVRRYLASPVLLPIVCGDLSLYREVTWRDAFKRLTKDTAAYHEQAKPFADELAREYLRKILPLHRRVPMPGVDDLLKNEGILLGTEDEAATESLLTLPQFGAWLQALLAGAVNGHENSKLLIPIPTVRALSQLLFRVRNEIPELERILETARQPLPETDLMRRIFSSSMGATPTKVSIAKPPDHDYHPNHAEWLQTWRNALLGHFVYEARAGAVCLVLMAAQHWQNKVASVLATPLFEPLKQLNQPALRYIETRTALNWKADLELRLPTPWVHSLPDESVLPFATPEIGRAVRLERRNPDLIEAGGRVLQLVLDLTTHRNFYASSKQATLICSGRILELVVTSLVRDPTWRDIERIQNSPPFHSAAAVAATKPVLIDNDEEEDDPNLAAEEGNEAFRRDVNLRVFVDEIVAWRKKHRINEWVQSPWLIYCALNKTFNQAPSFNKPLSVGQQPTTERTSLVVSSSLAAFNAFWAAVASFEKGPLFNLPLQLSNVNLNPESDFESNELFLQNIGPLLRHEHLDETIENERVISVARALAQHPLRAKLNELAALLKRAEPPPPSRQSRQEPLLTARERLISVLGLRKDLKQLRVVTLVKAIIARAEANSMEVRDFARQVYDLMDTHHRGEPLMHNLESAMRELSNKP
ncbi:antiviral RADAR system adenosine triphosphatase RdrA [Pelomonas sp. APW6]|uniref:Antiviral RADAR system adenosine triphosphatase RdrA n=1 Tax=Roseateles subflavus TaxID=3053353 RepID=A0ABT7LDJ8_9BURK|nr:antiviral RADAR system adenosine triphosphatase RdrA [Pelomonas sp. APW6]MDL5030949.1 antiviral RADAR system adenosine triphosphatase RdrA [Pelomonas sp. APW6]